MNDWRDRLSLDPDICHGKVCIKGTRVMVSVILDNLAALEPIDDIVTGYHLQKEDVQAAIHYAAELARERVVPLGAA
jgi:uncharacterized protein (DUF433 family)